MKLVEVYSKERLNKVKDLYEEAFPKSEKKPFGMILKGRKKGKYEILSIESEKGEFQGLAITMHYADFVLLDYFAISPECRGSGIGGEALRALQKSYTGKKFLLEIESTVGLENRTEVGKDIAEADEAALRLRRKEFYLRNGMQSMNYLVNLFGVEMEIMTYGCSVSFEEYHSILEHILPFGMAAKVRPAGFRF